MAIGITCGILIPEPLHPGPIEVITAGELPVRRGIEAGVGDGIIQKLLVDVGAAAPFGEDGHNSCHIAADAVSSYGQCRRIDFKTALFSDVRELAEG